MAANSWDRLRPKLGPNPSGHLAGSLFVRAMLLMTAGAALVFFGLGKLLRLTEAPISPTALGRPDTWVVVFCLVGLRVVWNTFRDGNNLFVVNGFLGWTAMALGALGLGWALHLLTSALPAFPHDGGVLDGRPDWSDAPALVCVLVGLWLFVRSNGLFARSRRYLAPTVRAPGDLDGLAYSLYLRTFGDDERLAGAQAFGAVKRGLRGVAITEESQESLLVDALSTEDPMVAVGRPGEAAPHVGALRMYLPDEWQPAVRELVRGARHVVLVLGWGEGTLWELGESVRLLRPERLILVVAMDRAEYERFRGRAGAALAEHARRHPRENGDQWVPPRLPDWTGPGGLRSPVQALVHFSLDWTGTFAPLPRYSPVHNSLRISVMVAAHPAFRRLGHPPRGVFRALPVDTIR
ncbi:hypothetical protein AB0I60_14275 [Actinosynnema sp. NPDC050436]|uniref:hypothetical protein n=1 Tax=Actinosynnema sp. NPDC050436 TaxID=3155659 RepID=UPI0033E9DB71